MIISDLIRGLQILGIPAKSMKAAAVNAGKIMSSWAVSGGVIQTTTVDGSVRNFMTNQPNQLVLSSGLQLAAGYRYKQPAGTGIMTVYLPVSPANGDQVIIEDVLPTDGGTRFGQTSGITISAGATNWVLIQGLYHSLGLNDPSTGILSGPDQILTFTYVTSTTTWTVSSTARSTNGLTTGLTHSVYSAGTQYCNQISFSGTTASRTFLLPDYNVSMNLYNTLPAGNSSNTNTAPTGIAAAILSGGSGKASKAYQAVLFGFGTNSDGLCPEFTGMYADKSQTYSSAKVSGGLGLLKAATTGTASGNLVTGSNTNIPAYLTKPTGHKAVSLYDLDISMTSTAGAVYIMKRRVHVTWDGTTAVVDVQAVGTDYNPATHTITFTPSVTSGLLMLAVADTSAAGGDTTYWQCTYRAHHNGG